MKQILLLAAIYSLVINQSYKNAETNSIPAQRTIKKMLSSSGKFYQQQNLLPNTNYGGGGFISSINSAVYTKWQGKAAP